MNNKVLWCLIEFDVDDMTSEELALSVDLLRESKGVVDVVVQTARGKKNRAVELIRILARQIIIKMLSIIVFYKRAL